MIFFDEFLNLEILQFSSDKIGEIIRKQQITQKKKIALNEFRLNYFFYLIKQIK